MWQPLDAASAGQWQVRLVFIQCVCVRLTKRGWGCGGVGDALQQ